MTGVSRRLTGILLVLAVYGAAGSAALATWRIATANDYAALGLWVNLRATLLEQLQQGTLRALGVALAVGLLALLVHAMARRRDAWRDAVERWAALLAAGPGRLAHPAVLMPLALAPVLATTGAAFALDQRADESLARRAGSERPNVVLVVVDTLRADALGAYGAQTGVTPNIDAFARRAAVYRRMTAQSPCTINSSPSILASLYPSEHGYVNYKTRISDRLVTLAEVLREDGYDTFAISSNPHVSVRNGLAQGFDHFSDDRHWADTDAEAINRAFLDWLPERPERPFFAMLWYIDPHEPYDPPAAFRDRHLEPGQVAEMERVLDLRRRHVGLDPADQAILEGLYRAEVEYFDAQFAELLAALEERALLDDAVLVLTSDHGESFGENVGPDGERLYGHGRSLHEGELAVPLIVKLPGWRGAGVVDRTARSIDVTPTVLDAVGAAPPPGMHTAYRGRSLIAAEEEEPVDEPVFAELVNDQYGPYFMQSAQVEGLKRVETFVYREHEYPEPHVAWLDRHRGEQLLDEAGDRPHPGRSELRTAMARWREGLEVGPVSAARFSGVEEEELREQLRALGYLE